jgi:hypothetical protein
MSTPPRTSTSRAARLLALTAEIIRDGFAVVPAGFGSAGGDSGWCYTVGLSSYGLPELVVVGVERRLARALLGPVVAAARAGTPLPVGRTADVGGVAVRLAGIPAVWLEHDPHRMGWWFRHFSPGRAELTPPPVMQLLWGDANGLVPGEPGCDAAVCGVQPVLAVDPYGFPRRRLGLLRPINQAA